MHDASYHGHHRSTGKVTIIIIAPQAFNRLMQAFVDHIANEAIAEAKAYVEVQELERIATLQE